MPGYAVSPRRAEITGDGAPPRAHLAAVGEELKRLLALQWELGRAEGRAMLRAVTLAVALALVGAVMTVAAMMVLVAGLVAYALGVAWSHLVGTGGTGLVIGLAVMGWGLYRFKRLPWPVESRRSIEETLSWLAAQVRFRLRFG
jgi:Putative Actinobacterial Holin-X, holin superfamily III